MLSTHAALRHLEESLGIEAEYTDVFGKLHRTSPETAARILEAKGIGIRSALLSLDPSIMVISSDQLPSSVSIYFQPLAEDEPGEPGGLIRIQECSGRFGRQEYALSDRESRYHWTDRPDSSGSRFLFPTVFLKDSTGCTRS